MATSDDLLKALGIDPSLLGAGHWNYPDYQNLIANDATYKAALASIEAGKTKIANDRANSVAALIYGFGDPRQLTGASTSPYATFLQTHPEIAGDITPATIAAAGTNPYSYLANTALTESQSNAAGAANAAARGVLQSGAYTDALRQAQDVYDRSLYAGVNDLLGPTGIGGAYNTWEAAYQDFLNQQRIAQGEAAGRVQALYPPNWVTDNPTGPKVTPSGQTGPGGLDTGLAPVYGNPPVQPTTWVGIGATPEPIPAGHPWTGDISPVGPSPDQASFGATVHPPGYIPPAPMVGAPVNRHPFDPNWLGIQ